MNEQVEKVESQPKKKRVLHIVINVLLVLVLLFGIFCSYTAFTSKKGSGVPSIFGIRVFSIQSDSMADTFHKGDLIVDTKVDPKELTVNDVITFWTIIQGERVLNTHRITEIHDNGTYLSFTTKGDNNSREDYMTVHENEIVGEYHFAIPNMGSMIDFLQTSTGFLVVIVLPVFLFFIYNLVQFFRVFFSYKKEKMRMELQMEMSQMSEAKPTEDSKPADQTDETKG